MKINKKQLLKKQLLAISIFACISSFSFPTQANNISDEISKSEKNLDWWAASINHVKTAKCRLDKAPNMQEMIAYLEYRAGNDSLKNAHIVGFQFKMQKAKNIELFNRLVGLEKYSSFLVKNHKQFQSNCQDIYCAAQEMLGRNEGIKTLYLLARFGYNANYFRYSKRAPQQTIMPFTSEQLDDIILGFSLLPDYFYDPTANQVLVHIHDPKNQGTLANAVITIFNFWDQHPRELRQQTILHEVSHNIAVPHYSYIDKSEEWLQTATWKKISKPSHDQLLDLWSAMNGYYQVQNKNAAVSEYGKTNPVEDFAETAVAYRLNPEFLKAKSMEKYNFMRDVIFDKVEYTSEQSCKQKGQTQEVMTLAQQRMKKLFISDSLANQLTYACVPELLSYIKNRYHATWLTSTQDLDNCIEKNLQDATQDIQNFKATNNINLKAIRELRLTTQRLSLTNSQLEAAREQMLEKITRRIIDPIASRLDSYLGYHSHLNETIESAIASTLWFDSKLKDFFHNYFMKIKDGSRYTEANKSLEMIVRNIKREYEQQPAYLKILSERTLKQLSRKVIYNL